MSPEKEIARWQKIIDELQEQLEASHARVAGLSESKRPLTLDAATGDQKARAKLAEINAEIRTVEQEAVDLAEAITQAEAKLADADAEKARIDEMA